MAVFYKKLKKVQWNSIIKKQNGLEQTKFFKSSTLPRLYRYNLQKSVNTKKEDNAGLPLIKLFILFSFYFL